MARHKRFLHGQLKIIKRIIPIVSSDMVLEVGCGIGALISLLKEIGIRKIAAIKLDPDVGDFVSQSQDVEVSVCKVDCYPVVSRYDKISALEGITEALEHFHNLSLL